VKINDISLTGASIETNVILVQGGRVSSARRRCRGPRVEGGFLGVPYAIDADELNEFTKL